MCGIAGFYNVREQDPERVLGRMLGSIRHRGPDEKGVYLDGGVALGIRRLSIVDLLTGQQPISNEDGSVKAVCNGEIYNYRELSNELLRAGHRFSTRSDVESIVHAYEEYGTRCLDRLRGMFSFCLYDRNRQLLFCGRDRLGKKPFHYFEAGGRFAFASEIRALLETPFFTKEIDGRSLAKYLVHGFVPAPQSIFKGVRKLLPGHYLLYDLRSRECKTERYWDFDFSEKTEAGQGNAGIEEALLEAVKSRLVSEVPMGAFLSGGIDSGLVVAMMARFLPPREIKTFSIGFEEKAFDESVHAGTVAQRYGTDHHLKVFKGSECMAVVDEALGSIDEPISDPSLIPTYLLSRFAKDHIKVALSGDGGDEIFGGYPKYCVHRYMRFYDAIPGFLRKNIANRFAAMIPLRPENYIFNNKVSRFIECSGYSSEHKNQLWTGNFMVDELEGITGLSPGDGCMEEVDFWASSFSGNDLIDKMMYLDAKLMLADMYLVKVDRASMMNSLEVRSPFLDQEVVSLASKMPSTDKVRGLVTKRALRQVALKYLPKDLVYRKKKGFGLPVSRWLREGLLKQVDELLAGSHIVNRKNALKLLHDHRSGAADNAGRIWNLYVLLHWYGRYGK